MEDEVRKELPIPQIDPVLQRVEEETRKVGRPTIYTPTIGKYLANQIATTTKSNKEICESIGLNYSVFVGWCINNSEFSVLYLRAKAQQANEYADDVIEISDEEVGPKDLPAVKDKELRMRARQWRAERQAPKVWGQQKEEGPPPETNPTLTEDQFQRYLQAQMEIAQKVNQPPANDSDYISYEEQK